MSLRLNKPIPPSVVQKMVHNRTEAFTKLTGKKPTEAQKETMKQEVHKAAKMAEATRR